MVLIPSNLEFAQWSKVFGERGDAPVVACNISRRDQREKLISGTLTHYGKIDMLVCNVAANPHFGPPPAFHPRDEPGRRCGQPAAALIATC